MAIDDPALEPTSDAILSGGKTLSGCNNSSKFCHYWVSVCHQTGHKCFKALVPGEAEDAETCKEAVAVKHFKKMKQLQQHQDVEPAKQYKILKLELGRSLHSWRQPQKVFKAAYYNLFNSI